MHAFVFVMVMRGGYSYYKCFIIYSLPLFSVPPCYNNPCENGGTCTEVNNAATSISRLFRNECKLIVYLTTMHVYCGIILWLSCNIKKSKTTAKLSENSWNKISSNRFQCSIFCICCNSNNITLSIFILQLLDFKY
jgi:hypothetical protein